MSTTPLRIALPSSARIAGKTLAIFEEAALPLPQKDHERKLRIESEDGAFSFISVRSIDVPTFVEYGAADIGVCGLDTLRESGRNVYEPLLLPFGHCRLSVCGFAERSLTSLRYDSQPRVATHFPSLTMAFFRQRGINAEVIHLHGSVELAPLVGMADLIVDLVETGNTLRANGLVELRKVMDVQAVLIANRASFRLRSAAIQRMLNALRVVI